jgi:hypothetical protein
VALSVALLASEPEAEPLAQVDPPQRALVVFELPHGGGQLSSNVMAPGTSLDAVTKMFARSLAQCVHHAYINGHALHVAAPNRRDNMARFHAVTWQDGNFERTASIISFGSRAARAAFPAQCAQRVEAITHRQLQQYLREGRPQRIAHWDAAKPTQFQVVGL